MLSKVKEYMAWAGQAIPKWGDVVPEKQVEVVQDWRSNMEASFLALRRAEESNAADDEVYWADITACHVAILYTTLAHCAAGGLPIEEVFDAIHDGNMADHDGDPIKAFKEAIKCSPYLSLVH